MNDLNNKIKNLENTIKEMKEKIKDWTVSVEFLELHLKGLKNDIQ